MSPMVSKARGIGVRGKTVRKELVTEQVISGCLNSDQESTAKTTSAHSQEVDHHQSWTAIISMLGRTLLTTL